MAGTTTTSARNPDVVTMGMTRNINLANPAMAEVMEETTTVEGLGGMRMTLMTTRRKSSNQTNLATVGAGKIKTTPMMMISSASARNTTTMTREAMVNLLGLGTANQDLISLVDMPRAMVVAMIRMA